MTGQSNQQKHLNSPTRLHSTSDLSSRYTKGGLDSGNSDDDDADENSGDESRYLKNNSNSTNSSDTSTPTSTVGVSSLLLPSIGVLIRLTLGVTVALYILNQKHLLPRPVSKIVSHVLFWPTLPITISKRLGKWFTPIDDTIIMGGAPFGFAQIPELLYEQYNVRNFVISTLPYPVYLFVHLSHYFSLGPWCYQSMWRVSGAGSVVSTLGDTTFTSTNDGSLWTVLERYIQGDKIHTTAWTAEGKSLRTLSSRTWTIGRHYLRLVVDQKSTCWFATTQWRIMFRTECT